MYKVQVIAKKQQQQNKNQNTKKKTTKKPNKRQGYVWVWGKVVYWVSFIGICS